MQKNLFFIIFIFFMNDSLFQEKYTNEQLVGKSDAQLVGLGYKLQKEVKESFELMWADAVRSGIDLKIVSSYRSFKRQEQIWTKKYNRFTSEGMSPEEAINKIIEYSTIPGTSRHHWGTDIDIIDGGEPQPLSVLEEKHFVEGGVYFKLKKWMDEHANTYGFYLVYTDDENRKGFKYEPWHYSYKPISKEMLAQYQKIDIQELLKKDKLVGSDFFTNQFISDYVNQNILDINPVLKSK